MVCNYKSQNGQPNCKMYYELIFDSTMTMYLALAGIGLVLFIVITRWYVENRFGK